MFHFEISLFFSLSSFWLCKLSFFLSFWSCLCLFCFDFLYFARTGSEHFTESRAERHRTVFLSSQFSAPQQKYLHLYINHSADLSFTNKNICRLTVTTSLIFCTPQVCSQQPCPPRVMLRPVAMGFGRNAVSDLRPTVKICTGARSSGSSQVPWSVTNSLYDTDHMFLNMHLGISSLQCRF